VTDALRPLDTTIRDKIKAAERFMAAGRLDEAGFLLDGVLKLRPYDPDVLNALAALALAAGDLPRAGAILRPATTAYPHHSGLVTNLGTLHQMEGRLVEAQACFLRAAALAPDREAPLHALALTRLMAGDSDGAEEVASRLLNRHPDSAGGFGLLGLVALARDDRPSAIAAFRQALARQPEDPAILRNLSACCLQEGDAAEALALAERAHLAAPLDVETTEHLALCQAEAGRMGEAEATCRTVLAFAPNHIGLRGLLARIHLADGRAEAGLAELTQFARANPRSAEAMVALAIAARQAGRPGTATPLLDHALALEPAHATARALRDEIALAEGRFPEKAEAEVPPGSRLVVPRDLPAGEFVLLARFLPALADAAGTVKLSAPEAFATLAAHLPVSLDVARSAPGEPTFPFVGLLRGFTLSPDRLWESKPYLSPDPALRDRWRRSLEEHPRPWIGVAWNRGAGGLPMAQIRAALPPDGSAVSLMVDEGRHELKDWPEAIDAGRHLADFAQMIALIANLDAVIGPDVAMLHIAGALGRPGVAAAGCHRPWAWANREGHSLWYPTLRVATQSQPGAWDAVVEALRAEVVRLTAEGPAPAPGDADAPR